MNEIIVDNLKLKIDDKSKKVILLNEYKDDITNIFLDFISDTFDNFSLFNEDLLKIPEENLTKNLEMFSRTYNL